MVRSTLRRCLSAVAILPRPPHSAEQGVAHGVIGERCRSRLVFGAILLGVLSLPDRAMAAESLTVGVFIPDLPGIGRAQRLSAVQKLAGFLRDVTGLDVDGVSFSRGADLLGTRRGPKVDFAVAPAHFLAAKGLKPIAVLTRGGRTSIRWQIVADQTVKTVAALQGKRVIIPRVVSAGRRSRGDRNFVANVLLEGEIDDAYVQWDDAPDAASAIRAVSLGKARAAIVAEVNATEGLKQIYQSKPVPTHAMAVSNNNVSAKVRKAVSDALMRWKGDWLVYDGWAPASAASYAALENRMRRGGVRKLPPIFRPATHRMADREVTSTGERTTVLPPAREVVQPLKGRPDRLI